MQSRSFEFYLSAWWTKEKVVRVVVQERVAEVARGMEEEPPVELISTWSLISRSGLLDERWSSQRAVSSMSGLLSGAVSSMSGLF
jgi:hypothetical protein